MISTFAPIWLRIARCRRIVGLFLDGQVAEWLCSGLQSRVRRFDSDLSLHIYSKKTSRIAESPRKPGCPAAALATHLPVPGPDAVRTRRLAGGDWARNVLPTSLAERFYTGL